MPAGKSCPNCGAPFDLGVDQCPYCGTIYFDLSCIDFTKDQPIFLKIRMNINGRNATVTQRVLPTLECISLEMERREYQRIGSPFKSFTTATPVVTTDISFKTIYSKNGEAVRVVFDDERT